MPVPAGPRVRRPGGGRKPLTETDPGLAEALEALVEPLTRGHPESPLRWTCKSTAKLAEELHRQGHSVSDRTVAKLLHDAGYSLQSNRKTREGSSHPDRNAQFEHINERVRMFQCQASRSSRWTPRRRNWWGISRTPAGSGGPKAGRKRSGCTTSAGRALGRRSPMAFTM